MQRLREIIQTGAIQAVIVHDPAPLSRNRKYEYLLSGGRFRCGRCGRTMTGRTLPNGIRRYSCNSLRTPHDPEHTCRGSVAAEEVERQVWVAVMRVLEEPEIIAAEVTKQETMAEDQRAEIRQQMALIETTLAKCDREAQRWADAYAAEVITLAELKGYRTEIEGRRQSLLAEREAYECRIEAIRAAVQQVETLIDYCARVRAALQSFEAAEKRLAFEALDIHVTWTPGQPPRIQGTIPIDTIAPIPPAWHRRCSGAGESRA